MSHVPLKKKKLNNFFFKLQLHIDIARISETITILKSLDGQDLTPLPPSPGNFFNIVTRETNNKTLGKVDFSMGCILVNFTHLFYDQYIQTHSPSVSQILQIYVYIYIIDSTTQQIFILSNLLSQRKPV